MGNRTQRMISIAALLAAAGCATPVAERPDTFTAAAASWEGAPVSAMIEVWGPPASQSEATESRLGLTHWRSYAVSGGIGTGGDTGRRCQIDAYSDVAGIVQRVEVNSTNCDEYFGDRLNALFRAD